VKTQTGIDVNLVEDKFLWFSEPVRMIELNRLERKELASELLLKEELPLIKKHLLLSSRLKRTLKEKLEIWAMLQAKVAKSQDEYILEKSIAEFSHFAQEVLGLPNLPLDILLNKLKEREKD
jgi:hypothetical protein